MGNSRLMVLEMAEEVMVLEEVYETHLLWTSLAKKRRERGQAAKEGTCRRRCRLEIMEARL